MQEKLMKWTAVYGMLFSILSCTAMFLFMAGKDVIYAKQTSEEIMVQQTEAGFRGEKDPVGIQRVESAPSHVSIEMRPEIQGSQLSLENSFVEHRVFIIIEEQDSSYWKQNKITAAGDYISEAFYSSADGKVRLELQLTGLYEHEAVYKNNTLYLDFHKPWEKYDKIVVIDVGNEENTTDMNLQVALILKEMLDKTDIKAYFTRLDSGDPSQEERVALANESQADLFISIHMTAGSEELLSGRVRTVYNPHYFIPFMGSIELSDIMEEKVAIYTGLQAEGLAAAEEEDVLIQDAMVPAAKICIEYPVGEVPPPGEEDFRKIAEGIYAGIMEAYQGK